MNGGGEKSTMTAARNYAVFWGSGSQMIGVFDSGSGGLSVLEAVVAHLPGRDFLYLGDHARAPYGERSAQEVYDFTLEAVDFLLGEGCRLVLIACNTAAAVALRRLQQGWLPTRAPDARVLGVHVPLVERIIGRGWHASPAARPAAPRSIAVFATPRTIASNAFATEIGLRAPEITVLGEACPGLADAIEAHADDVLLQEIVDRHVTALLARPGAAAIDAAALACTHYPFALAQFRKALPADVAILTQPEPVAAALVDYLARHPGLDMPGSGRLRLLTTGDPTRPDGLARRLPPALTRFERKVVQGVSAGRLSAW